VTLPPVVKKRTCLLCEALPNFIYPACRNWTLIILGPSPTPQEISTFFQKIDFDLETFSSPFPKNLAAKFKFFQKCERKKYLREKILMLCLLYHPQMKTISNNNDQQQLLTT
jgi:hypothetical protein